MGLRSLGPRVQFVEEVAMATPADYENSDANVVSRDFERYSISDSNSGHYEQPKMVPDPHESGSSSIGHSSPAISRHIGAGLESLFAASRPERSSHEQIFGRVTLRQDVPLSPKLIDGFKATADKTANQVLRYEISADTLKTEPTVSPEEQKTDGGMVPTLANQKPYDFTFEGATTIPENVTGRLGYFYAFDDDGPAGTLTYDIQINAGNGAFGMGFDAQAGMYYLTVANAAEFDYEKWTTISVTLSAYDGQATTALKVTFNLINQPTNPSNIAVSANQVHESNGADAQIGQLTATDPEGGTVSSYQVIGDDRFYASFSFADGKWYLYAKANAAFDYETTGGVPFNLTIRAFGSNSTVGESNVSLQLVDDNEAPTDVTLESAGSFENTLGANLGLIHGIDPDHGGTGPFIYTLVTHPFGGASGALAKLEIVQGNRLKVLDNTFLDKENLEDNYVFVKVTDEGGLTKTVRVNLAILNTNEKPTVTVSGPAREVYDDWTDATPFTNVTFADPESSLFDTTTQFTVKIFLDQVEKGKFDPQHLGGGTLVSGVYQITGTLKQVQDAVRGLIYDPRDRADAQVDSSEVTHFTITISDGSLTSDAAQQIQVVYQHNRAPINFVLTGAGAIDEEKADTTFLIGTLQATDPNIPDNATLTYGWDTTSADFNPHNYFDLSTDGKITLKPSVKLDFEAQNDLLLNYNADKTQAWYNLKVQVSDGHAGGITTTSVKVFINDINFPPTNVKLAGQTELTFVENSGDLGVLTATDPDRKSMQWSLADSNPTKILDMFMISPQNHLVARPNMLDYETATPEGNKRFYTVKVQVQDADGGVTTQEIKIYVTNINETPANPTISGGVISETDGPGTTVGRLLAADPDGDAVAFTFKEFQDGSLGKISKDGKFEIMPDGTIKVRAGANLTVQDDLDLFYEVIADDRNGGVSNNTVKITILNFNHNPSGPILSGGTILENANPGDLVGQLSATDQDIGDTITFTFVESHPTLGAAFSKDGRFQILSDGTIVVIPGANLRVDATQPFSYQIAATDNHGGTKIGSVVITIEDRPNHNPTIVVDPLETSTTTTDRALPVKPFDGVTFGDLDGDQLVVTVRFANTGTLNPAGHGNGMFDDVNDEWVFEFVGSASDLTNWFQNDITFDFYDSNVPGPDVTTNFRIEVKDSPQATPAVNQEVSVLTHVMGPVTNHAPTGAVFDATSTAITNVAENDRGAVLGVLRGIDQDSWDQSGLTFAILPGGDPSLRFEIENGVLKLKDGVALDWDVQTSYSITVTVTDTFGATCDQVFTINVTDQGDPPNNNPDSLTFATGRTTANVLENRPGATVGFLLANDPDQNDFGQLTYELISDPDNLFVLSGTELKLQGGKSLDIAVPSHTATVRVWDAHGGFHDQVFTINSIPEGSANQPPLISVSGQLSWSINDIVTVAPFKFLGFSDAEDDATTPPTPVTVIVNFHGANGIFQNFPSQTDFPNVTYTSTSGYLVVSGTNADVTAFLRAVKFNPTNHTPDQGNFLTDFRVTVIDSNDAMSEQHVTVDATSTGIATDNVAPTITVDPNGGQAAWQTTDILPVKPFKDLNFADPEDGASNPLGLLSVSVTFTGSQGNFLPLAAGDIPTGVTFVYTEGGNVLRVVGATQQQLNDIMHKLQFDPTNRPLEVDAPAQRTTFDIELINSQGDSTSAVVTVDASAANLGPNGITLVGGNVPEDTGINQSVGDLHAVDPNGDAIDHYVVKNSSGGRFSVQKDANNVWQLIVTGALDYDTPGGDLQSMPNPVVGGKDIRWYEVKIAAVNSRGLEGAEQTVSVFVTDADPDNSAPTITVDPNGTTDWNVMDIGTVAPFSNLTFADAEDGPAGDIIGVIINFDGSQGVFENLPPFDPDVTFIYDPLNGSSLEVRGTQDDVNAILRALRFNPTNRPGEQNNPPQVTDFNIELYDSRNAWTRTHVYVRSQASGLADDNLAPTITVSDTTPIPADDWNSVVNPFAHVDSY